MKFPEIAGRFAAAAVLTFGIGGCSVFATGDITRDEIPVPNIPFVAAVTVPPGYTTYYISGTLAAVADPNAPVGSAQRFGDTETQTASVLARQKETMAKLGLTFGDVVQAHVFLVGDPAVGGKMDFAGLNKAWLREFGIATQPNKPARAAVQVSALAVPGALVEIEFVAAKKAQ
jgi:enamine deaminase RidA (YjgF/YER057c/UK114 family)